MSEPKADLTARERVCALPILWLVEILAPWEYKHQHDKLIDQIKEALK